MNRIEKIFAAIKQPLIAADVCGAPDMATSEKRIRAIIAGGANIINLIIPFSDPMADGAEVQQAAQKALQNGATLHNILPMIKNIRQDNPAVGLIVSGYCNVFMQYGYEKLFQQLAELEIDGILINDLPFEERSETAAFAQKYQVPQITDCGLTDDAQRLQLITADAQKFVITANSAKIDFLRNLLALPVAAPCSMSCQADAVIAGKEIPALPLEELTAFVKTLCEKIQQ